MDFLNKATTQLSDLFKSMSPGARLTAGLLLIVVVVSLAYLFNHEISRSDAFLMGGEPFPAAQLPAMEAAFDKAGLHNYEIVGSRVRVPLGQQAAFMGALADAGALPPDFGKFLEKAVDSGPFTSRVQQEERIKHATVQELQLVIRSMKGIERAAVLYDVQKKRGFGEERVVTASVSVKPAGTQLLDEERVSMVRHVVASAIAGLKPEGVTVIDLNGRHYPAESGESVPGGGGGSLDRYSKVKSMYEKHWENQIASALRFVPNVEVTANVELDTETGHEESITLFDPKAVVFKQEETNRTKTSETAGPAGRPGLAAQGGTNQPARVGSGEGAKTSEEDSHAATLTAVPTTQKKITQHGLTPKRVTVSVGVPSNYYTQIWNERNPPVDGQPAKKPTDNELAEIETKVKADLEKTVVGVLPSPGTTVDPFPRVTVTTFQHLADAPLPVETAQDQALAWLGQHWSTLGMVGVALVSLMMLRSMLRAAAPAATPPPAVEAAPPALSLLAAEEDSGEGETPAPKSRLKRRGPGGPSLRDELAVLVRDDPDAAVSILRTWIGNPA